MTNHIYNLKQKTNQSDSNSEITAQIEFNEQQINEFKEGFNIIINKESENIDSPKIKTDEIDERELQRYKMVNDKLKPGLNQLNYSDLADITLAMNEKVREVEKTQNKRNDELIAKLKDLRKIKEELRS
jgi:hypothetical protein